MNQPIRRVALFCFLLIVTLLVSSNYLQVVNADNYKARAGNKRTTLDALAFPRGKITTADGTVIAQSLPSGGISYKFQRNYPLGPAYANITGYKSIDYGSRYLEGILDGYLQGTDSSESVANFMDTITGKSKKGGDVQLTLNNAVQQAAVANMKGRKGSVVALDPTTGAILAMYSDPTFDPNGIASNDHDTSVAAGKALEASKDKPNLNHTVGELYPPGSIFKVVTAGAALDTGAFTESDPTGADARGFTVPGAAYTLTNENASVCPGTDLKRALAASCNSVYGFVGAKLGPTVMNQYAQKFGFNTPGLKIPLTVTPSSFPSADKIGSNQLGLAQDSIGQGDTQVTPLQAAMVAAAVANGGTIMQPYLVDKETAPNGHVTYKGQDHRHVLSQAVSPQTAAVLDDMMQNVVTNGTASNGLAIDGAHMGAKTGTAQQGDKQNPLAWFISYASIGDKHVAVAVLVQTDNPNLRDDITGSGYAGPVAKAVMEAALGVGQH
ncbi:penicillin-binding transpeptidase domain-containing protein [Catenulispora yoronensis]|uniref:Penicillin-binding transpeptidase domain-containing protein n=1 Tax=Catenulispora yoronensis TaxID=450799 RepID=A0ABP5GAR0_9ACTN